MLDTVLDDGYTAMAADQEREAEAQAWCNALLADMTAVETAILIHLGMPRLEMGSAGHSDNLKTRSFPDEPRKANQE